MVPPPRPRRRPLLGNIPDPDELSIPLDLEEAIARMRGAPIVEDPYQLPPIQLTPPPKRPAAVPEPPGYLDTLVSQMRGEAPTAGALTGAAGGAAAVGADPEGRRRGILERAFAAADEGAYTGGPVEKGVGRYDKEHEEFNRSLEIGARVAREKGGEPAAEQYIYNLHKNQFGGRVAEVLRASRDHARRRLAEGSPAEAAAAEGEELARRHLENLRRAAEAGELGEDADTAQRAVDMLSENLGSPKGIARLAVTTGLPMIATAAGTVLGGPVIGAGAGVAARTAATRMWREGVEGEAPDPMVDLTAGVTELLDVPGVAGLRAAGGAIRNPLLRTAALTAGGAISEGAQESAQAVTEGLLQSGDIPRGLDIASQGLAGALVGGALGPLVGAQTPTGRPTAPPTAAGAPGVAPGPPGAPPAAPGTPPGMPPDAIGYLGSLGYDLTGGPDSWVAALERALQNGDSAAADLINRALQQTPTVQAAAAERDMGGGTAPRVDAAVREAVTDLQIRLAEAMRTGRFDLAQDIQGQIDGLLAGGPPPAPTAAPGPRTMGPVPGAAPGPAAPRPTQEPRDMGPITVTPVPGTVAGATPEEAVTAGAPAATQDLLDQARGEGSGLPAEAGVGIVGGDLRGAGGGGVSTPVVPTPTAPPPIQPPPPGTAGTSQAFAPPPAPPSPPTEAPTAPAPPQGEFVISNPMGGGGPVTVRFISSNGGTALVTQDGSVVDVSGMVAAGRSPEEIVATAMGDHPTGTPPDVTKVRRVGSSSSPSPAPSAAPAPAAGPTVPDLLKALIRGAQTQEEAGALLSIAGRIQAAFGNNPPVEALDRLREQGLTPAEDDALSAFQLALAGGLTGPETTPEEVAANIPNAPAPETKPMPWREAIQKDPAQAAALQAALDKKNARLSNDKVRLELAFGSKGTPIIVVMKDGQVVEIPIATSDEPDFNKDIEAAFVLALNHSGVKLPGPPATPAAPAAPSTAEPTPEPTKIDRRNSVWAGRGAKGNIRVIFPDANHKELYVLGQRRTTETDFAMMAVRTKDLAKRLKIPESEIGKAINAYRDIVKQGIADLETKAEWIAPPWTGGTGQVDWEPPAPPPEPPAPPGEPPAPGPATAGEGTPVRGYVKQGEKDAPPGEKWVYREEDPDGQVVSEQTFGRKVDAEGRRKMRALQLARNRRELRDKNLHPIERDVASRPPSSFGPHPDEPDTKLIPNQFTYKGWNLAIQKEFHEAWLKDGKKPAPLFKMLAAAKRLGAIVHPDWEKEFPGLDLVEATGQRSGVLPRPAPAPTAAPPAGAPPAGSPTIEDERISDVDGVAVVYRSGMSRMGDLLGGLNWETPIGVDINELTGPAIEQIANAYSQGRAPHVFVDSGAFTAFKKGVRQDIDAVVARYRALVSAINEADVNGETLGERRLVLTVPDVIADQDATLELIGKHGAEIAALGRNVVLLFPLQTGTLSLDAFRREVLRQINLIAVKNDDSGLLGRIAWGIPSNAAAAPADQIAELGDALRAEKSKATVHFLGASSEQRLRPLLDALGGGLRVTADANRLRALIGRVGSREDALGELLKTEGAAPDRPEIDPADDIGLDEDEPPAEPPTPIEDLEPAELGPRSAAALERWLRARKIDPTGEVGKELTRIVVRHRTVMRELQNAEGKLDHWLKAKPWAVRGSAAEIKRNRKSSRAELENAKGNYDASVKALRDAVAKIPDGPWRSFFQIAENRIPEPRQQKGAPGALLPRTVAFIAGMKDAPIDHPIDFDTLEARVIEYAKTAVVSEAAILTNLESAVARTNPDDWKKLYAADLEGVGDKTVREALTAGPTHPAWKKIVAYQMRSTAERRAIEEALSEDGWPLEMGLGSDLGTVAAAMAAEVEALPAIEDPELPWGLTDPATGKPVRARAALAALQARRGRLYARIFQALEDSLVGQEVDEVPFDIPEGNPDDIPPFEVGEDATDGYLRAGAREEPQDGRSLRLLKLLGFRAEEDKPAPRPSILNMPLGKPLIQAAQQTLDFGPPRVHTPVREPVPATGSQPVPARPGAGGRGGAAPGRTEAPPAGVRGPGAGEAGRPAAGGGGAPQPTGVVVPTVSRGDDIFKIVTIRPNFTLELPVRRELVPSRLLPHLDDHQQIGVARAIEAMSSDQRGFLLADGTGVGKTREILATAEHFAKQGRAVIIIAPAAVLNIPKSGPAKGKATGSYADDSRTMGVELEQIRLSEKTDKGPELKAGKVYLTHYESFFYKNQVDDNTVVIFDEAHNIKNPPDVSRRGGEGQKFAAKAHAVMFATATPGDQAHHLMYAQRIGLLEGRSERQFLADMGMVQQTRMKADGTAFTVWKARDEIVMRRAIKELYGRLTKAGKMIRREVDFSPVEVEFRDLPVSAERAEELEKIHGAFPSESAFDVRMYLMHARRQLEPDKIQATLDIMDRELAAGRSVVIFAQRLNRSDVIKRTKYRDEEGNTQVLEELITSTEGTIKTLREALLARGLTYAEITGDFAARKDDQIQLFQSGRARVAIATVEGGGTGINLDDRLGTRPRTLIMMTAPLESTVYIQAIGRVHRKPTKSRSRVIGLFSDHEVDTWNKQIIADKLQLQGAQVAGSVTRLDPTKGGDVDVDFGEDVEVLRPGSRRHPTDDGNTQPQQKYDLPLVLSSLKTLVTYNGRYQNPKRLWKESAYRIHRRAVTDLGGVIDIGGEWFIETKDGWVVRGKLTHPNERQGTYGTFEFDQGAKEGVPSGFGVESDDRDIRLVRDVDKLIELIPQYKTWRNFHREHRETLENLFGVDAPLFARLLGATSQRAGVEVNITLALRAYEQLRTGRPFTGFQPQVIGNLEAIREDEALAGSKIAPYTQALMGDEDATWVDRHIGRLVLGRDALGGEGQDRVSDRQGRVVRAVLRQAAGELGWTPAQMSSASWAAGQVLEGGVREENIRDYARSLQARATAIRRFYDYFGPVAGPGRRPLLVRAASPAEPRNLGFGTSDGRTEPEHRATGATQEEGLRAIDSALTELPQPHAVAIGTGFTSQDTESWELWWTALAANFNDQGGGPTWTIRWSDYAGMDVSTPSHIASIANIARNAALEQASVVLVKDGKLHGSLLSGSGLPGGTQPLPEGWTLDDLRMLMRQTGSTGYYLVHNHPDGVARPSRGDLLGTAEIAAGVPGFMGHVVVNHGTYQVITPAKIHAIVVGQRRSATFGERALMNVFDQLQEEFAHSVGSTRSPDPMLAAGMDPEEYWRSDAFRIKGVDPLVQKFNGLLLSLSRGSNAAKWPMIVLVDNRWRLRAVTSVNPDIYFNKAAFTAWLDARKKDFGAHHAFVAIEQTVGGTEIVGFGSPEGWGESNRTATFDATTRDYVWSTVLMGAVDPEAAAAQKTKATIENTIGTRFTLRGFGVEPDRGGTPPPEPPRPPGDDPDDPGWRRRVTFADARARAGGPWTISRLTDALVAGVDRFLRGLKDFARWAASMNYAGLGPYLRAMWARIQEMFRPRAYTQEGRPRSLADGPIEDQIPGPGGRTVLRPIPRVRPEDLQAAVDRVAEGRRETPRIAPARGPNGQPGERPPAPPGSPINLDRIEDQDDIKNLMRQVMEALRARFQQVKSYRSWEEVRERAEEAGLTEQDVARLLRENGVLTDVQIEAIRMLRQDAMIDAAQKLAYTQDVRARLAVAPNDQARAALEEELLEAERSYRAALHRGIGIMFTTVAAGSEAGRALAIHRRMIESLTPGERFMRRLLRGIPENERFSRELADAIMRNDLREVMRLYHKVHKPTFWGYFNEYFINSILSGPATLIANVAGNVTHEGLLRTPERGIASFLEERGIRAMVERFFGVAEPEGPQRVSGEMREAAKALLKLRMGFPDMWREFRLALTEENIPLYSQGEWSPPSWPGRLGTIIRTPGRLMKALDVASKKAAAAAERAAQVYRLAVADVRSGRTQESELTNRVLEIDNDLQTWIELDRRRQANPRLLSTEDYNFLTRNRHLAAVVKAMVAAADKSTFQEDVLPLTRMLMTARARHPWLTPFVPFIKTPERIIVAAAKRTPMGLVQALNAMRTGALRGGEASDRIAQGVLGTATGLFFYEMAIKGFITGGGPSDPKERQMWLATGKLPYAIRIGSTWYSLARIEPLATILGFAADLAEAGDAKTQGDAWDKLHYSILNNITNKTYLEGMINAAEALSDPDRYGAQFSKRMVGSLVPNLLASAARAIDPTIRQTDSIGSTLMARLPILSESLPAKLTGTGEPRMRPEIALSRFMSPIRYSEEGGPERNLERIFLETGYSPSAPPRAVRLPGSGGREFMLDAREREIYAEYARRATGFARQLAQHADWTGLDVYQKEEVLKRIYRFAHDSARRDIYRSVYQRAWAGKAEEKAR